MRYAAESLLRVRCWWFGCEFDQHDSAEFVACVHCHRGVSYGDMVGDTRHVRTMDWLRYWLFRRWIPAKCNACGGRYRHRNECDGIPF